MVELVARLALVSGLCRAIRLRFLEGSLRAYYTFGDPTAGPSSAAVACSLARILAHLNLTYERLLPEHIRRLSPYRRHAELSLCYDRDLHRNATPRARRDRKSTR